MPIERVDTGDTDDVLAPDNSNSGVLSNSGSNTTENTTDTIESESSHLKLTVQDLEDLEKIQAELDSLASLGKRSESPADVLSRTVCSKVASTATTMASIPVTLSSSSMSTSSVGENVPVTLVNMGPGVLTKGGKSLLLVQKPVTPVLPQVKAGTASKVTTVTPILTTKPVSVANTGTTTFTMPTLKGDKGDLKVILPGSSGEILSFVPGKRLITPSSTSPIISRLKVVGTQAPFASGSTFTTANSIQNATILSTDQPQAPTILLASPTKPFTVAQGNTTQLLRALPGSPVKQGMVLLSPMKSKVTPVSIAASVSKSPQKIAPAPNTAAGSKVTIVSASSSPSSTTTTVVGSGTSVLARSTSALSASPQKIILRPLVPQVKPGGITSTVMTGQTLAAGQTLKQVVVPVSSVLTTGASSLPGQVPGSKFNYFRLVSAPQSTTSANTVPGTLKTGTLVPVRSLTPVSNTGTTALASVTTTTLSSNPVRITLPIAPAVNVSQAQVISKSSVQTSQQQQQQQQCQAQRLLIQSVRPEGTATVGSTSTLSQFPPNTLISANTPTGMQNFVMVSAQYLAQMASQTAGSGGTTRVVIQPQHANILPAPSVVTPLPSQGFVPIASAQPTTFDQQGAQQHQGSQQSPAGQQLQQQQTQHSKQVNGRTPVIEPPDSRIRKPCNCTKSQCLKLYCDCFANGEFCNSCNCNNCFNNLDHEEDRQRAIKSCLDRNPQAFHPKIGKGRDGDHERRHTKGCNCKRSGCLKNYCECYEAKILCTNLCKCVGCKNFEDSSERKTLMHLADAAEVRVQQQAAARTKISSQIQDLPTRPPIVSITGERLPFSFVTQEVMEATCQCLLAQAEDSERSGIPVTIMEKLVLEEFGRCLMQIIDCANRTKVAGSDH